MDVNFRAHCKRLAVRIALDNGQTLIGSGIILGCEQYKYALVFTAAHVIGKIESEDSSKVHFCFSDGEDNQRIQEITIKKGDGLKGKCEESTGYSYVHPKYVYKEEDYPEHDAAIICIPYYEWMRKLPKFQISEPEIDEAMLVGFPAEYDKEIESKKDFDHISYRGNIYDEIIKIENTKSYNLVIKGVNPFKKILSQIDHDVDMLSGGGIFSVGAHGLTYNGALASTKDLGKDSYYVSGFKSFIEIMNEYGLRIGFPDDLDFIFAEQFKRLNRDFDVDFMLFSWYKQNAKGCFRDNKDILFDNHFMFSDILTCENYRPLCFDYRIGRLLGTIIIDIVYKIDPNKNGEQIIRVGDDEDIHVEHICSEKGIEYVVSEILRKGAFSNGGIFRNRSIFVINRYDRVSAIVSRGMCRNIICNIGKRPFDDYSEFERFAASVKGLSNGEVDENSLFSITEGNLTGVDIGFVELGRLEEAVKESLIRKKSPDLKVKTLMEEVWEA